MLPINIDISDIADQEELSQSEIDDLSRYIVNSIATEFCMLWDDQIDQNLNSTREEYRKGIFQEEGEGNSITLGLTARQSQMSMMIEEGASSFDEKEGFEKSEKRTTKKDGKGWYLTIPFRFATSEAVAESGAFANKLPKPIENLVKQSTSPLRESQLPGKFKGLGSNATSGYKHKFNIYEGLQRIEGGSGKNEKRGLYMNFRRVSDTSDPAAWIHPGFDARNLMDKALDELDVSSVVDHALDEFLSNRQ